MMSHVNSVLTSLSARSPVFARMFEHEETNENKLNNYIDDIEPDVLKEMLTFV